MTEVQNDIGIRLASCPGIPPLVFSRLHKVTSEMGITYSTGPCETYGARLKCFLKSTVPTESMADSVHPQGSLRDPHGVGDSKGRFRGDSSRHPNRGP